MGSLREGNLSRAGARGCRLTRGQSLLVCPFHRTRPSRYFPRTDHETHLPAFQAHPQTPARLSRPHGDQRRPGDPEPPPSLGLQTPPAQGRGGAVRPAHAGLSEAESSDSSEETGQPASRPAQPRLRFPKITRLTSAGEFRRVREKGRSWGGRFLVLGVLTGAPPDGNHPARIGFVTSKRVGGAVVRNTVRRRLREAVRVVRPHLKVGCWVVLVARYTAAKASTAELAQEWLRLARRASILMSDPSSSP